MPSPRPLIGVAAVRPKPPAEAVCAVSDDEVGSPKPTYAAAVDSSSPTAAMPDEPVSSPDVAVYVRPKPSDRDRVVIDISDDEDEEESGDGRHQPEARVVIPADCQVGGRVKEEDYDDGSPRYREWSGPGGRPAAPVVRPPPQNPHKQSSRRAGARHREVTPTIADDVRYERPKKAPTTARSGEGGGLGAAESGTRKKKKKKKRKRQGESRAAGSMDEHRSSRRRRTEDESGEAGERLPRAPAGSGGDEATRARKEKKADEGTQIFTTKIYEGLCLLENADTSDAGCIRKRTRSNFVKRRSKNKKLLKQGTFSKPYCVDSEEDDEPPPVEPHTSSWEYEDESDHGTAAKQRPRKQQVSMDGTEKDDDDSEDDRTFRGNARNGTTTSRRPKKGAAPYQQNVKEGRQKHDGSNPRRVRNYVPNGEGPADTCDQYDDITFSRNAQRGKRGPTIADQDMYDDLFSAMFDDIQIEGLQNGSVPAQAQGGDTMPLVFSFWDEDKVKEKSEDEELEDELWAEFDFALESTYVCSDTCEEDEKSDGPDIAMDAATSCNQRKHVLIVDEQIGVRCKHCDYIDLEIRHVMPLLVKLPAEREGRKDRELDLCVDDLLTSIGYERACSFGGHKTGSVWDLIPGIQEDMFPHQREAFEFMWTKLAGSTDIEQMKHTTSGCVISHAPGTGKTRLAITFIQSYLENFPQCHPVIIAPSGMLATWEKEFGKWNVKIPFHVLNFPKIHWNGDKTMQKMVEHDDKLAHVFSANKLSDKSRRLVQLKSWSEGNSIIGVGYELFTKLARDESMGGTVRQWLLGDTDLLVLDEGHKPRNNESIIWQVLAEVRTRKRIILSGTPFQNNFRELENIMQLVSATQEDQYKDYWSKFDKPNAIPEKCINEMRERLDPFVHIYTGGILQTSLPGLIQSVVVLKPLDYQKEIIAMIEKNAKGGFFDLECKISLASVHPSLIKGKLPGNVASEVNEALLEDLKLNPCEGVKTRFVVEIVRLCEALKERVLVFSQYRGPLELIMAQLINKFSWSKGKEVLLMNGDVLIQNRQALMDTFNDMESEAKVMLASTKACGEGITLIGASRVVLLDVVWNPSVGKQAIGRAYRFGQKKTVYTYNLIASGTKEKEKYDRQAGKGQLSKLLFSNELQPAAGCNLSPESIVNDSILEAMTAHEQLKDIFVKILPSH